MNITISEIRQWASWLLQLSVMFLTIWLPLRDVLRTGDFRRPFFSMWAGLIGWSIMVAYLTPLLVILCSEDVKTFEFFPDVNSIKSYAAFGWAPSLVICGAAYLVRMGWTALSTHTTRSVRYHGRGGVGVW